MNTRGKKAYVPPIYKAIELHTQILNTNQSTPERININDEKFRSDETFSPNEDWQL